MVGKGERRYQRMLTVIMFLISLIMVIPPDPAGYGIHYQ